METSVFERLLAVVRLGDVDRLGWWRSHSVDETAEYVLSHAFPSTWRATGLELGMESARIRHDSSLARPSAVHLFSDFLPFRHVLRAWLIERKLETDFDPLAWLPGASIQDLRTRLGEPSSGERRGAGLYMGDVARDSLDDDVQVQSLLALLAGAYVAMESEFVAPYVDLVA